MRWPKTFWEVRETVQPAFRDGISLRRLPLPLPDEWIRESVTKLPDITGGCFECLSKTNRRSVAGSSRAQIENRTPRIPCNIVTYDAANRTSAATRIKS